eukprot:352434-Chlamydomonas_euryale.AAC.2
MPRPGRAKHVAAGHQIKHLLDSAHLVMPHHVAVVHVVAQIKHLLSDCHLGPHQVQLCRRRTEHAPVRGSLSAGRVWGAGAPRGHAGRRVQGERHMHWLAGWADERATGHTGAVIAANQATHMTRPTQRMQHAKAQDMALQSYAKAQDIALRSYAKAQDIALRSYATAQDIALQSYFKANAPELPIADEAL